MADKYTNFKHLSSEMTEGVDYNIRQINRQSLISIVAPHGGKIEPGTSELAEAIASNQFNFYAFEGIRLPRKNVDLHITSHIFDEPNGLKIAEAARTVLGVHGRRDRGNQQSVYLGGLDTELVERLISELLKADFPAEVHGYRFQAKCENNICNRGSSGRGAQLEIPKTLRDNLLKSKTERDAFVKAIRNAIDYFL